MMAKVITAETFRHFGGTDLATMESDSAVDPSAPFSFRVRRAMTVAEFVEFFAKESNVDAKLLRPWVMVNRQNKTIRPDQPIMDLTPTIEEVFTRSAASRDTCLRLWMEQAEEVDGDGNPVWPSYSSQPNGLAPKTDVILLMLKHFDIENQTLRGVGHVYVGKDK